MKKVLLALVAVVALTLTSCNNNKAKQTTCDKANTECIGTAACKKECDKAECKKECDKTACKKECNKAECKKECDKTACKKECDKK